MTDEHTKSEQTLTGFEKLPEKADATTTLPEWYTLTAAIESEAFFFFFCTLDNQRNVYLMQ